MLIEIHMIQNHSPSNLNRDDLGAPKTCVFGGVTRARISSQCLKRSIRNPGNPEDVHNREAGMFAHAMEEHIGVRSKLFPWLVERELKGSTIPEGEHDRIVMAAQRIATAKEKERGKKSKDQKADDRPMTPQLISFGRGDAKRFVAKLLELRGEGNGSEEYLYFLNPLVGFEEMVGALLASLGLDEDEKDHGKIKKAAWVIAKCRMGQLSPEEDEDSAGGAGGQPGRSEAERIAKAMVDLRSTDDARFTELVKAPSKEERKSVKEDAPKKPGKMDKFIAALKSTLSCRAIDVALFGRMTTSDLFEDVEAAMQVAHAISTHAAVNETDYFTAVDDLSKAGGGAGHVDEAQFNSACFYKYFSLDWDQLVCNLAGPQPDKEKDAEAHRRWEKEIRSEAQRLAACALGHFIRAATLSTPSGKRNSFAHNNDACGILVEIKKTKVATNYANAFAEPVERIGKPDDDAADEKSYEGRSVACLADHVHAVRKAYGIDSTLFWYSPKLWRFPFKYWERAGDGKKMEAKFVTDCRFDVLGGEDDKPAGLVEAVVAALGLNLAWAGVKDAGRAAVQA
jgi:hypothetical protein